MTRLTLTIITISFLSLTINAQSPDTLPVTINGGIVNGKAIKLPVANYPPAALAVKASGEVKVELIVDEKGDVISAEAISGHPLLRAPAVEAAKNAKFRPTMLNNVPVRVKGIATYYFDPNPSRTGDYMLWTAIGSTLGALQEVEANAELEMSAAQNSKFLPETYAAEKEQLALLPNVAGAKRTQILSYVISSFERKLVGREAWEFEIGLKVGAVMAQARNYTTDKNNKFDESEFRTNLIRINDLAMSASPEIPSDVIEKLRQMASFVERSDLRLPEVVMNVFQSGIGVVKLLMSKSESNK